MKNVCLVIIDGYGIPENGDGDATIKSHFINRMKLKSQHLSLFAHGEFVGLQEEMMGNSEVGHMTIGSGRVVEQSFLIIKKAYETGELKLEIQKRLLLNRRIHLIGMLSDAGIHSHVDHLKYILNCIPKCYEVCIHAIADGIDVPSGTIRSFIGSFDNVTSVSGRYFAMDRDKNFDRLDKFIKMLTAGTVVKKLEDVLAIAEADEFIEPTLLKDVIVSENDTALLFNFRADRMIQLYDKLKNICPTYTLIEYKENDPAALIKKGKVKNTLSEWISMKGMLQAHIAETEKKAHITYFFKGGNHEVFKNEDHFILQSPTVTSFSEAPATAMKEVASKCIKCIKMKYNFIVINLAGPDLVGHSGDFEKTIEAVSIMDTQIEWIYKQCLDSDFALLITADHGNAEKMLLNGKVCKSHTRNKVLFLPLNTGMQVINKKSASLQDVAPSILAILDIKPPDEMTGESLLEYRK
ncbi:hypothetical protein GINT2_001000 [Glugoides intestinalis]